MNSFPKFQRKQTLVLLLTILLVVIVQYIYCFSLQEIVQSSGTSFTNVPESKYCVRHLNFTENTQSAITVESFYDCGKYADKAIDEQEVLRKNPDRMDLVLFRVKKDPVPTFGLISYQLSGSPQAASGPVPQNTIAQSLPEPNFQMWVVIDRIVEYTFDLSDQQAPKLKVLQDYTLGKSKDGTNAQESIKLNPKVQNYGGVGRQYKAVLLDMEIPLNTSINSIEGDQIAQVLHIRALLSESEARARTGLLSGGGSQGGRDAFAFRTTPTSLTLEMTLHQMRRGVIQGTGNIGYGSETLSTWAVMARVMVDSKYSLNTTAQKEALAPYTTTSGQSYPLPYDILPDYYMYNVSKGGNVTLNPNGVPESPVAYLTIPRFAYGNEGSRIQITALVNNSTESSQDQDPLMTNLNSEITRVVLMPTQKQESVRIGENRDATSITTLQFAPLFIGGIEVTDSCQCANTIKVAWDNSQKS